MILKLQNIRARFMNLYVARAPQVEGTSRPRYDITLMIPKGSDNDALIKAEYLRIAREIWKDKAPQMLQLFAAQSKIQYRDGDVLVVKNPEYAGHMILTATAPNEILGALAPPPEVRDADGVTKLTAASGKPYPGCYVTAFVEPYHLKGVNERLNCGLRAVQFVRDGEAFAGVAGVINDDMFDRLAAPTDPQPIGCAAWD